MADVPEPAPNAPTKLTPEQIKKIEDVAVGLWPFIKKWLPTILIILSSLGVGAGGIVGYQSMRADPAPAPTPAPVPPQPAPVPPTPAIEPFIKLRATSILANAGEPVWIEAETNAPRIHWFGPEGIQFRSFKSENLAFLFASKETKSGQYRVRGFVGTDKSGMPIEQTCVVSIVGVDPVPVPPTPTPVPVPVPVPVPPVPVTPTIKVERLSSNPGVPLVVTWSGGTAIEGTDKIVLAGLMDGKEVVWRFAGSPAGSHTFGLGHVAPGLYEWRLVSPAGVRLASTLFQVVGQMPIPPPVPPTPVPPTPTPTPPAPVTPTASKLYLLVIDDAYKRTIPVAQLLTDKAYWDSVVAKGHTYRNMDSKVSDAAPWLPFVTKAGGVPCVIVMDQDNPKAPKLLATIPLPADKAGVDAVIKKYTGK